MRHTTPGLTLAGIAALLLVACGGGGGSASSSSGGTTNTPPVANAGASQTVVSGVVVTLNGTASSDPDGTIASYAWTQSAGTPAIVLTNGTTSQPTFSAPAVVTAATLTFSLVVTDNRGTTSLASTVNVTVNPGLIGNGNVTGVVTFARVQFAGAPNFGLNYANPVQRPARGVLVEALAAGSTTNILATASTNDLGVFTLNVATNTMVTIRVTARMVRGTTQSLPRWNVRVQDGTVGDTPYTYTDGVSFNSDSAATHDIAIPTGIAADGTPSGARSSGPFAELDTVYQAIQTILGVAPLTSFPDLIIDWGSQSDGTFFTSDPVQHIALLADLTEDTDEFDQHVIAHEFGHYIEFNFSRADNIGGAHGLGDKLDPRVAFGEGFGYAFAAIVLNDPVARDSFVNGTTQVSGTFNIETNPATNSPGTPINNYGCWCSESSVWSILWDINDNAADTNDTLALGFQPIWDVLTGAQKTTPAFTTIFSFITALKAQYVADTATTNAINTLVGAQNIDAANIDAYGTNETHFPATVPSAAALPIYRVATVGGAAVVLRNVDDAGHNNKLGNRRFVRFNIATARTITITASSSNTNTPDTDFRVFRNGAFLRSATGPPAASEIDTFSAATGEYLLDVYDCANGCDDVEGTPGDYNLTVTIN
ncbi:MAG TPA: PKD domain-containing protein [Steroidobacteraceae bacterium]|jgi:hypothetical protein|nr:PKD domain-containing protein [Steroidobacteraceae bacterium]